MRIRIDAAAEHVGEAASDCPSAAATAVLLAYVYGRRWAQQRAGSGRSGGTASDGRAPRTACYVVEVYPFLCPNDLREAFTPRRRAVAG